MATKENLDFTYTTMDRIHRLAIGETADITGARYDGDFSMTLEEAQRKKHEFIVENCRIKEGSKVLDMGCGWGPFLNFVAPRGVKAIGLTLSTGQYNACRKRGFEVYIKDVKTVKPEDYGMFDSVVSVGAFEHFCSVEEYKAGLQDKIYRDFFETVSNLLPSGGRFYLQTMTFTDKMLDYDDFDIHADKKSNEYICALIVKYFPGSWLPYGSEMVLRNAEPYFKMINMSSGRADYIETIEQWKKKLRKFHLLKYYLYIKFLVENIISRKFWHVIQVFLIHPNKVCFERDLMQHYRIVFEKK